MTRSEAIEAAARAFAAGPTTDEWRNGSRDTKRRGATYERMTKDALAFEYDRAITSLRAALALPPDPEVTRCERAALSVELARERLRNGRIGPAMLALAIAADILSGSEPVTEAKP